MITKALTTLKKRLSPHLGLSNSRLDIASVCIGHALHANGCVAAYSNIANHNLARLTACNMILRIHGFGLNLLVVYGLNVF